MPVYTAFGLNVLFPPFVRQTGLCYLKVTANNDSFCNAVRTNWLELVVCELHAMVFMRQSVATA
jgi:hypothetical protein